VVLSATNVVDDVDHVCRERTSLHLAEQLVGHRKFVHGTIVDALDRHIAVGKPGTPVIFSPFGLGVLDLALASRVAERAGVERQGSVMDAFASRENGVCIFQS
jgi:ornithine cyclodeaminase